MAKAHADRLMDMCRNHADEIAEVWYKALSSNSKTTSFRLMPKEGAVRHAMAFYKNLEELYFAEDCFKAVEHTLDVDGFAEDYFMRGIPIEEALYTLVLLRRHIWSFADGQALYDPVLLDLASAVESVNRIVLIFDYADYIVAKKYREFGGKNRTPQTHVHTIFPNLP
jgi:hypothetical protein